MQAREEVSNDFDPEFEGLDSPTGTILIMLQYNKIAEVESLLNRTHLDYKNLKNNSKKRNLFHFLASSQYGDRYKSVLDKILHHLPLPLPINGQDENGNTPLMIALLDKQSAVACALLNRIGLNINAQNDLRQTALMLAAQNGYADTIKMMFERFPILNPNLQDTNQKTALHHAVLYCKPQVVCYLISTGMCDYNLKDDNNMNVFDLAKQFSDRYSGAHRSLYNSMLEAYHFDAKHKQEDDDFTLINPDKTTTNDRKYAECGYAQDVARLKYEHSKNTVSASVTKGISQMICGLSGVMPSLKLY